MRVFLLAARLAALILAAALFATLLAGKPAEAGWLSRLVRETGGSAAAGAKAGLGALKAPVAFIGKLPLSSKTTPLAVHAAAEGHWSFANREGEVFTAGSREEIARAAATLAPAHTAGGKLALYLSEETVFAHRASLGELPPGADLHAVSGGHAYPLVREAVSGGTNASPRLYIAVRANVRLELQTQDLLQEALFHLDRPLDRASLRVLALEPGGPADLPAAARFDKEAGTAVPDVLDPGSLSQALQGIPRQTVLITGHVEGGHLHIRPSSGGERSLDLAAIMEAAANSDIRLILLDAPNPLQPGGRNWFWQRLEVLGLNEALKRPAFADFLETLASGRGMFTVTAVQRTPERTALRVLPPGAEHGAPPGGLTFWWDQVVSQVTGNIVTAALEADVPSRQRQVELDLRFIPFIPALWQFLYFGGLVLGLMGFGAARGWWARLWPPEPREAYAGSAGWLAASTVRLGAFLLIFLPLAGAPAFLVESARQTWALLSFPFDLMWGWWNSLWPKPERTAYRRAAAYRAAQTLWLMFFALVFVPLTFLPAVFALIPLSLWALGLNLVNTLRGLAARSKPRSN